MKKYVMLTVVWVFLMMLVGCNQKSEGEIKEPETYRFEAVVLEVKDVSVMVCPQEGSNELNCADKISVNLGNMEVPFDLMEGQTIAIEYDGLIAESDPAQIIGATGIELVTEAKTEEVAKAEEKAETSSITGRYIYLDNPQEAWGIELQAENVTSKGLTIVCHQSGGADIGELNIGSFYTIQLLMETEYVDIGFIPSDSVVADPEESWTINEEATTTLDVNWEGMYGELPPGKYRIGKLITNFKETGEHEQAVMYVCFEVK